MARKTNAWQDFSNAVNNTATPMMDPNELNYQNQEANMPKLPGHHDQRAQEAQNRLKQSKQPKQDNRAKQLAQWNQNNLSDLSIRERQDYKKDYTGRAQYKAR